MKEISKRVASRWQSFSRGTKVFLIVLVVLLVGIRLAAPWAVERYVNRKLDSLPNYDGRIGTVDIHLWRGAYSIEKVNVMKVNGKILTPFFSASRVDLSVQWKELLHGAIVSEIVVDDAKLNFVKGPTPEESQTGVTNDWTQVVKDLVPFEINQFQVRNGEIWFRDITSEPKLDVFITNMFLLATNFNNSRNVATNLPAGLTVRGSSLGGGKLHVNFKLNPLAKDPTFVMKAEFRDINLPDLNNVLKAYAKIDLTQGDLNVFSEIAAADGAFEGYITPLLEHVQIVDLSSDKNPLTVMWEVVVAGFVHLFKNHEKDSFGTKIPVSGSFNNPQVGIWPTIGNIFHNFITAFPNHIEGSVTEKDLNQLENKVEGKASPKE